MTSVKVLSGHKEVNNQVDQKTDVFEKGYPVNNSIEEIVDRVINSSNICIITHRNPDPDAVGSSLALYHALKSLNKDVSLFLHRVPASLTYLIEDIDINSQINNFDLFISVDCGDLKVMYDEYEMFYRTESTMNIDHHKTNNLYSQYNYVQSQASATGEVLYRIIKNLVPMTPIIAECLYTAIVGDTCGFKNSNTTPEAHEIASELISYGIDVPKVSKCLYDYTTPNKLMALAKSLQSLELFCDNKVAIMSISYDETQDIGIEECDLEGIVDYATNLKDVEVGIFLKPRGLDKIRVSLRANSYVDVSQIAMAFEGGGHDKASGCTIIGSINEAKEKLLEEVKKHI